VNTADLIGWIGTALFALGGLGLAYKLRVSFLLMLAANLVFTAVGFLSGLPSLITVSLFLAGIDAFGWWKWRK